MQTLFNLDDRDESHALALGWQWAYGCFETFLWRNGSTLGLDWHIGRLRYGCGCLGLEWCLKNEDLAHRIASSFSHLPNEIFRVRVEAVLDDPAFLSGGKPPFKCRLGGRILRWQVPRTGSDFSIKLLEDLPNELQLPSPGYKPLNYALRLQTRNELQRRGIQEGILARSSEQVIGGLTSNLFVLDSRGDWITPPLQTGALTGVTRHIALFHLEDIRAREAPIRVRDLAHVASAFVTNSTLGIQPVSRMFLGQRNWKDLDRGPANEAALFYENLWNEQKPVH